MKKETAFGVEWVYKTKEKAWQHNVKDVTLSIKKSPCGECWQLFVGKIPMGSSTDKEFLQERASQFI